MTRIKYITRMALAFASSFGRANLDHLFGKVLILTYHRVLNRQDKNNGYVQPGMYVFSDTFERHIRFLKKYFEFLRMETILDVKECLRLDKRKRYCLITFDDGWKDNYLHALPILRKYHVPATVFLIWNKVGTTNWLWSDRLGYLLWLALRKRNQGFDKMLNLTRNNKDKRFIVSDGRQIDEVIEKCKSLPLFEIEAIIGRLQQTLEVEPPRERVFLDWNEIEEMTTSNIAFGSHGLSHQILTQLSMEELQRELAPISMFRSIIGKSEVPVIAYPNGNVEDIVIDVAMKLGYQAAVTTQFGYEDIPPRQLFRLRRITIHEDVTKSENLFELLISGLGQRISDRLKGRGAGQ